MKNYPLNPFSDKWKNWTETYLRQLNSKVFALKRYSDFFLTDFIESEVDYDFLDTEELGTISIIRLEVLNFHNYARIAEACFLITDRHDDNATAVTDIHTGEIHYVRPISSGTTIISNARPEGSIDANGIQSFDLLIQDDPLYATDDNNPQAEEAVFKWLGFELPSYGPAHPDRVLWTNFIIQPTGYASLYAPEPTEDGLKFTFYENGGEQYGTSIDIVLFFQNARYFYIMAEDSLRFSPSRWGLSLYAKNTLGKAQIATKITLEEGGTTVPSFIGWLARKNPLMCFTYYKRNKAQNQFGEEIVLDTSWNVASAKLAKTTSLIYNITIPSNTTPPVPAAGQEMMTFEADVI